MEDPRKIEALRQKLNQNLNISDWKVQVRKLIITDYLLRYLKINQIHIF